MVAQRPASITTGARLISTVTVTLFYLHLPWRTGWALSSPSPLHRQRFGTAAVGAAPRKVTAADLRRREPRSYVPDGLTAEQYQKIKNDERTKHQNMNFGMWGPRFHPGDPDGNWFHLPSLWTGGFDANGRKVGETSTLRATCTDYLRRYGVSYLMLLIPSHLLIKSLSIKNAMLSKWIAVRMLLPFVVPCVILKPLSVFAAAERRQGRRLGWWNNNGTAKVTSVLAVLMSIVAYVLR